MLEKLYKENEDKMNKAIEVVEHGLGSLRTGRASAHLLDGVVVPVYGSDNPIPNIATVTTPDGSTIMIVPWDKNVLGAIEKAILQANIGLTPNNDGKAIRLNVPPLTEETRKEMVKRAHTIAEEGRIAIRNVRRHMNDEIKRGEKNHEISEDDAKKAQAKVQTVTDNHIKTIDKHLANKEKEIMTV
ncbi:MAG: ribosome recycling factor [bacterium]|nr:ribosome recycling factor [bacterium]